MMATEAEVKRLLEAGVHFGHRTDRWNPKMKEFIFAPRNGIYIIDLSKTAEQIRKAAEFLRNAVSQGGRGLFVGTKKPAQEVVKELAERTGSHYVNGRWLGGTLTNLTTIRRSVGRLKSIEEKEKSGAMDLMPKKEAATLRREKAKLGRNLAGILEMDKNTGSIFPLWPWPTRMPTPTRPPCRSPATTTPSARSAPSSSLWPRRSRRGAVMPPPSRHLLLRRSEKRAGKESPAAKAGPPDGKAPASRLKRPAPFNPRRIP